MRLASDVRHALEPTSLESILLDVGILGALVATIVVGIMALRRRR